MDEMENKESVTEQDNTPDSVEIEDVQDSTGPSEEPHPLVRDDDPVGVKKRLGIQQKKHNKEMRRLQSHLEEMQKQMESLSSQRQYNQDPYSQQSQPAPMSMTEDERIQHAVRQTFAAQEAEKRRAQEAEKQAHVQRQYKRLESEFDKASDKYDDFDDVVKGDDAPFTEAIRDSLLLIDNPAEVAYKLGKNRDELARIAKLHPIDQAREVNKLSFALMGGKTGNESPERSTPMNSPRANPVASGASGKLTPSEIRRRIKSGTWK